MLYFLLLCYNYIVALLAEGVDRNIAHLDLPVDVFRVALLAEGVDRNLFRCFSSLSSASVALLAEGVDRNHPPTMAHLIGDGSPSSRRAWIEIHTPTRRKK